MLTFERQDASPITLELRELIVAGWSGRDPEANRKHAEELAALGVKPPSTTPLFYRVGSDRITTAPEIQALGEATSGEVETFLLGTEDGTYVGVGSDHTDRDAETWSVAHAKQLCSKPVAQRLWRLDEVLPHWDRLQLEAYATIDGRRVLYQQGTVAGLLPPAEMLSRFGRPDTDLAPGQAMLCGTLPAIGGVRPAERFEMALIDPVRDRRITHAYTVRTLPVMA